MDFVSVGLANPSPRRPPAKGSSNTSSSLPPLTEFPPVTSSPRQNVHEISSVNHFHLDKTQLHSAQVASWPLTFASSSPKRESAIDRDPFSPISPKVRKLQSRTRLVDDSRTRPALLQELLDFLHVELDTKDREETNKPSLRRLQVVREALNRLIDGFNVYAPVLMRIRDEYEHAVEALHARSLLVPGLHTRLQSVESHCLRQLSACSAEGKARSLTLKRRLAETQAMLAASAAENARLHSMLQVEKENVVQVEKKLAEVQKSTLALASSVRRHDENLRAGHERSLEDARALQKVTARYYHACDELAELKKTVAALEEQGNGQHIAADKNTIILLSKELQELSARTIPSTSQEDPANGHIGLNHAFIMGLDSFGLELELPELLNGILSEGIEATSTTITLRLRQLQQQQFALLSKRQDVPIVFLTEPAELVAFDANVVSIDTKASGEFLTGRGMGTEVPSYLQHDGFVRNLFFPRVKIEQFVSQVWDQLDEQLRVTQHRHSIVRGNEGTPRTALVSSGSLLTMALERFLQRSRDSRADRIELAYNFFNGLERFSKQSSICRLFHLVFTQELPIEARNDQIRELARVQEALAVVDHDRHFSTSNEGEMNDPMNIPLPPGRVSLADVIRTLRLVFPWKSDAALTQLHRSLLVDLRGQPQVDYSVLLAHHPVGASHSLKNKPQTRSPKRQFAECLKMQRLDDLLTFRLHLQQQIRRQIQLTGNESVITEAGAVMISLRELRTSLHAADEAMPEQEVSKVLVAVSGLSARELLTHDDMMLDVGQVLQRLPTLLLRPTGRFF
ncbi:hypothetical protein P3T76_007526 [Phytophthora citrophthora]|uniref:Translin-associated factor X-interacting protein 1 N-terminal domain-containing protein n=1 Tax=Phytophthora citrophthora TaxID=4793 RepID=A0AAD9LLE0_9STRA|nr:hypothetical protein P3T76_007526 [Phytophthora citrophthora]